MTNEKLIDELDDLWREAESELADNNDSHALVLKEEFDERAKALSAEDKNELNQRIQSWGG